MRIRLLSALVPALLCAYIGNVSAVEAIPESCLKCRKAKDDASFITCLYDCLSDLDRIESDPPEIGLKPLKPSKPESVKPGKVPTIDGWNLKERLDAPQGKAIRTAELKSTTVVSTLFNQQIQPQLVLAKERGESIRLFVDVNPGIVEGFTDRVLIQFDDHPAKAFPLRTVWNGHAIYLDNKDLWKDVRDAEKFYVRLPIFGLFEQTFEFDLKSIKKVTRWLNHADDERA